MAKIGMIKTKKDPWTKRREGVNHTRYTLYNILIKDFTPLPQLTQQLTDSG